MQVTITADQHRGQRGYHGADLELPASRYAIDDALQRAQQRHIEARNELPYQAWRLSEGEVAIPTEYVEL